MQELERHLDMIYKIHPCVTVREIIPGPETNLIQIAVLAVGNGHVVNTMSIRKIHQFPQKFGSGALVKFESCPELEDRVKQFVKKNHLRGILDIEFKINENDGILYYIETNLRSSLQIELTGFTGANLPLLQYQYLTGQMNEHTKVANVPDTGNRLWMDPVNELYALVIREKSWWHALWLYMKYWRMSSVVSTWRWNDLMLFLKKIRYGYFLIYSIKLHWKTHHK
jgi:predicted ATP-grasp superfamily ATP-dependent carboligase